MKRLRLRALALAVLLALAAARPVAARTYEGTASATMSCTNNTATMTRTVTVAMTWKKVAEGIDQAEASAYDFPSTIVLGSDTVSILPAEVTGAVSLVFSFNDTTPFNTVQWYLYYGGHIAPVKGGQLAAANFAGCPSP